MGNSYPVVIIRNQNTWIEGAAEQQLKTTAALAGMRRVAGMPDLHPGRGYPVGAAFFSSGVLYPALIGGDIGYGMALWQRSECKGRLSQKYPADSLRKTALGSTVVCADKHLLYEEAPQAYKNIDNVVQALCDAGLVRVVARLKPVLTYKTAGGCEA